MNTYLDTRTNSLVMAGYYTGSNPAEFTSLFGCRVINRPKQKCIEFLDRGRVTVTARPDDWIVAINSRTIITFNDLSFRDRFRQYRHEPSPLAEKYDDD